MKRLSLFFTLLLVMFFSCQKEGSHEILIEQEISQSRQYDGEQNEGTHNSVLEDTPILKNQVEAVFAEYGKSKEFNDVLRQKVIETQIPNGTSYAISYLEFKNVSYKILAIVDNQKALTDLGIIRIQYFSEFLHEYYAGRKNLEDFEGVVSSYPITDFLSLSRNEIDDCLKLTFGDSSNSGGGIDIGSDTGDGGTGNPTGGDDGGDGGPTVSLEVICGCPPAHVGGNSNSSCRCKKGNTVRIVFDYNLKGENQLSTRNNYWDCLDILFEAGLITDDEIFAKRLKDCDAINDPWDLGPEEGNDGSNEYPDTDFCEDWVAYRDACLTNDTETNDAWGHFMLYHTGLFNSIISNPNNCISTEELEEIICLNIAVEEFNSEYDLNLTKDEKQAIKANVSCGEGFKEGAIAYIVTQYLDDHPTVKEHTNLFLADNPNNQDAIDHVNDLVFKMKLDSEFEALVTSSFGWSGIMWTIAKELIGDKAVDILAGVIGADEVRDAIKALKNNDWIEFTFEVSQLVLNNTPIGKALKILEAGSEMYKFAKKVEKIWGKIEGVAGNVIEQMWGIVSKYGDEIKTNSTLISGIIKTIKRGLKSIDDVMLAIPGFSQMSSARMKHILHGDTGGGLHHASGLVNDPSKKVIEMIAPNSKGVYKVRYEYVNVNGVTKTKLSSMFPDSKSEIGVAKSIENVYNNNISMPFTKPSFPGRRFIKGKDSGGIDIEIEIDIQDNVLTAYPLFN